MRKLRKNKGGRREKEKRRRRRGKERKVKAKSAVIRDVVKKKKVRKMVRIKK